VRAQTSTPCSRGSIATETDGWDIAPAYGAKALGVLTEAAHFSYNNPTVAATATIRSAYGFGPFLLDPAQHVLYRSGVIVPLPPKSVAVLVVLVDHAGDVVDKTTIFSAVWPETFVVESSLTKNISLLRKTLQTAEGAPLIETVSKRGYRFAAPVTVTAIPNASFSTARPSGWQTLGAWRAIILAVLLIAASGLATVWRAPTGAAASASEREYRIGRHIWSRMDRGDIEKALERFERAATLDPRSAVAFAGVAESHATMVTLAVGSPREHLEKAYAAARRSVELDPRLALPHVSLGVVLLFRDFDVAGAEREYRRALELEPDSVAAHFRYGCVLSHAGRTAEARALLERAARLDPVSPLIALQAARVEYIDHRYDAVVSGLRELLEREPAFGPAHYYLALALGHLGRTAEAREHLARARLHASLLATDEVWLRAQDGDVAPARELLKERTALVQEGRAKPTVLLLPAIIAGEKQVALDVIDRMWQTREVELLALRSDPRFDPLRSEPRFTQAVNRIWTH
jgi:DNA-binding winged helix-turn-helix (wHTH) protein/tetratricopeptide (TPR) repeat protein